MIKTEHDTRNGDHPYARVICRTHGPVGLSLIQYTRQLMASNRGWICQKCGENAGFDDEYFEMMYLNDTVLAIKEKP